MTVYYIERKTKKKKKEAIFGGTFLTFLYGNFFLNKLLCYSLSRWSLFSRIYGFWQKLPFSKKHILPFITRYGLDPTEFVKPIHEFTSFNDFFCRELKKSVRPLYPGKDIVIAPADGRYLVIPQINAKKGFYVKGEQFSLATFLGDEELAKEYESGAMVIARLCPTDYHRFHFPVEGVAGKSHLINGYLWSVNPLATKKNIDIFSENKRIITHLKNELFGTILYIEVGATSVGTIQQTYKAHTKINKGDEKGFFSFGGSSIILLFKPNCILFDNDLLENSSHHIETLVLMGDRIGSLK